MNNTAYLLRAYYQWIIDSGHTPILGIDSEHPSFKTTFTKDEIQKSLEATDKIFEFNISKKPGRELDIGNEIIHFYSFGIDDDTIHEVTASIDAIVYICSDETKERLGLREGAFFKAILRDYSPKKRGMNANEIRLWINNNKQKYIDMMWLHDWMLNIYVVDGPDPKGVASGRCSDKWYEYKRATIHIFSEAIYDEDTLKHTFVHELAHVATASFDLYTRYFNKTILFMDSEREIARSIQKDVNELLAVTIERIICGKPENDAHILIDAHKEKEDDLICNLNKAHPVLFPKINPEDQVWEAKKDDPEYWLEKHEKAKALKDNAHSICKSNKEEVFKLIAKKTGTNN